VLRSLPRSLRCLLPPLLLVAGLSACSDYALRDESAGQPGPTDDPPEPPDELSDLEDECVPVAWLQCGDVVSGDSGDPQFGRTDVIDFWPISQGNYRGPEVAYAWEGDRTGRIEWRLVHPSPTEVDHDLFVLEGNQPCRADAAIERGFNDVDFEGTPGEVRVLILDGYDGDVGAFEVALECPESS